MLMSFVNMKLRDQYSSLSDLCDDLGLDADALTSKLHAAGFDYLPEVNQFS